MLRPVKHQLAKFLPDRVVARLRKHKRQREAASRRRAKEAGLAAHGPLAPDALVAWLRAQGIGPGCVLLVQSSFNDMHTFAGRPIDLLAALRELVGPGGTLVMPAYTAAPAAPGTAAAPLDVANLPTYTGIVNELFRRSPGVLRSLHPRHSLCAEGPLAAELLADHHRCLFADGPASPFDRLRQRNDALILTIGLRPGFTSFLHWIEDHEPAKLPFPVHSSSPKHYAVRDPQGQVIDVLDMQIRPDVASRIDLRRIADALGGEAFRSFEHHGIPFGLYFVKPFSEALISLRDRGMIHYR